MSSAYSQLASAPQEYMQVYEILLNQYYTHARYWMEVCLQGKIYAYISVVLQVAVVSPSLDMFFFNNYFSHHSC